MLRAKIKIFVKFKNYWSFLPKKYNYKSKKVKVIYNFNYNYL